MDINSILIWQKFNCYNFVEDTHTYYWNGNRVRYSVTQFIDRFFEPFDSEGVSKRYAEKHNLKQEDVLAEWKRKGDISALAGTAIHSYMENAKRGKTFLVDYSKAKEEGLFEEVKQRVDILLPQAEAFHKDTLGKLFPIHLEYTVGIRDIIAGNIDMLCWNSYANEFQIWDYKNLKEYSTTNYFNKWALHSFKNLPDCSQTHYSIQLNMYKAILQRELGISIGGCYIAHFDYVKPEIGFRVHQCLDLLKECNYELDRLIEEERQ